MQLSPGTRLGPYEIVAPLGAGGMGEVYRARDTRLGREVAVKVLPQHLSQNPEVRARFEREAKTVSSLNHPHICTLFDVGREGDVDYLVMELIEGETLATRLMKGPLPVGETLRIGSQIADALDRAHRAGVVHRDLKPGNVMLTKSGAKLMDFGLARATGMAGPADGSGVTVAALTQSPTIAQPLTAEGTIVGTFQYMSPEQLEGKETDARSDLWAFGCVLYEMATGKRAFEGKSQASLIGAIMHAEPAPISQVAPMAPPELDRLVRACLVKDPADRLQSAHDVKLQLAWLADGASTFSGTPTTTPRTSGVTRSRWLGSAIVGVAAAAVTLLVMGVLPRDGGRPAAGGAPQRYLFGSADFSLYSTPALSPDGSYVVFSVEESGSRRLYRRDLSSFEMTPIAGTEDASNPFFAPGGTWIGFVTPSALKKVPAGGGVAQIVVNEPRINSGTWGENGMIYYTPFDGGGGITALARVPAAGGRVEVLATLDTTIVELEAWLPEVLPNGTPLISVTGGTSSWHIDAVRPDGSKVTLVENGILARYVHPGILLYADMTTQVVLARPFDPDRLEFTGTAVPLTEPLNMTIAYDASRDGKLVYAPQPGAGSGAEIVWLGRDGTVAPLIDTRATWTQPRLSPDGKRILLRKTATECELWLYDLERQSLARIVQGGDNHHAVWSPDGRRIAYEQSAAGGRMVALSVEGAREVTEITRGAQRGRPQSWSAGGNLLVFSVGGRGTASDIWVCPMDGTAAPAPFLATEFDETDPSSSPDGRWIAYVTNETGAREVFVRPYPATGEAWQVSIGGGGSPLWSRDGRRLYFTAGTSMMEASIDTRPSFRVGRPAELFEGGFNTARPRDFDVAADGRFVAVRAPGGEAGRQEMRVLLNWPAEMRRVAGAEH
ncbi:MAG TPA: protein kinase [Candidatus Krumholzibacteria bacterium]|nr:protein kinase [Candidatus Krumholzibacteria bacterium]